jgi:drug/metabolite transporter (DMT)-like permease
VTETAGGEPIARRSAVLFVIIASAAFSVAGPLARLARPLHPLLVAFSRVALAAVILGALDLPGTARAFRGLSARQRATVFGAGAILAAHFALFLWGLDQTSLPAAVSLVSLEPIGVVLFAWTFFGIRPTRMEQLGLLVATGGALLMSRGAGTGDHKLLGDLLILGAVVLYGLYVTVARALRDALPATPYAALVYASAALVLAAALPFTPGVFSGISPLPVRSALAVLGLTLIPTVIGHTAVQTASRTLRPVLVALVCPCETLGGILLGAAILGAIPSPVEIAGTVIILAGATIVIFGSGDRRPAG